MDRDRHPTTRAWHWFVDDGDVRIGVTTSRRELTTSTVVMMRGRALLVDPAWDPDELAGIAGDLSAMGVEVVAGFATHAHHDHVLWHPRLGSAPRFSSPRVAQVCARDRDRLVDLLGAAWPPELADLVGRLTAAGGELLEWPGPPVRPLTHDAHSPGHTALWLPDQRVLIAGDMLSDVELPLLETSGPADYAAGLDLLRPFVRRAEVLIPGHGTVAQGVHAGRARWRADRAYLDALIGGDELRDVRLGHPGMASAHADNLVAAGR